MWRPRGPHQPVTIRVAQPMADRAALQALIDDAPLAVLGAQLGEPPAMPDDGVAVLAEHAGRVVAALVSSVPIAGSCWLAGAVLRHRGDEALVGPLSAALRTALGAHGVDAWFASGDPRRDGWLLRQLVAQGFVPSTEVVQYAAPRATPPPVGVWPLRSATPADARHIAAIDAASFTPEWRYTDALIAAMLGQAAYATIAEAEGAPIGYAMATSHGAGRWQHLVRIAVRPAWQHRGIGAHLFGHWIRRAYADGATHLSLNTQADNQRARRLYERCGFALTGERVVILRSTVPAPVAG
ncbi:MAG: GNAT family N-acetyltransferase [Chloroflexi bacterium]|nr:GNAT family N-acetyltransferase [Chloroflexota bacterium]